MKDLRLKKHSQLKMIFWANLILCIILFIGLLYSKRPRLVPIGDSVVFQRYAIIFTLAMIPLTLKYFHRQLQKLKSKAEDEFLPSYVKLFSLRMLVVDLVLCINLFGIYYFEQDNFIYMCIITIFALAFTFPSKSDLEPMQVEPDEEEDTTEDLEVESEITETDEDGN